MLSGPRLPIELDVLFDPTGYLKYSDKIDSCRIQNEEITNFELDEVILSKSYFKNVKFSGTLLPKCEVEDVVFDSCDLTGINFEKSSFKRVLFKNSKLTGAIASSSYLDNVKFEECVLNDIVLDNSSLNYVDISNSDQSTFTIFSFMCLFSVEKIQVQVYNIRYGKVKNNLKY